MHLTHLIHLTSLACCWLAPSPSFPPSGAAGPALDVLAGVLGDMALGLLAADEEDLYYEKGQYTGELLRDLVGGVIEVQWMYSHGGVCDVLALFMELPAQHLSSLVALPCA
jgi:hypothetical protein